MYNIVNNTILCFIIFEYLSFVIYNVNLKYKGDNI